MTTATTTHTPVLQFVDTLIPGGAERLATVLAIRLDTERFAPSVACFRDGALAADLAEAGRPLHIVPKRRSFDFGLVLSLVRLVRRHRIALVHCHDIQSAIYGTMAARLTRVPAVLTVHGVKLFKQKRAGTVLPRLGRWMHRVVFVGHWLQSVAEAEFGITPRHPVVVHNGVDVQTFCPGDPDPELMRELAIAPGSPVVGTVGNLRPVKDYPCLVRAFAVALRQVPDAVLVFVGDGDERPRLESLARELGIQGSVRFAGARADVARMLRVFGVFALSSQTEGISVALLEAMATGLPAVVTDTGGNPEVVAEGRTGHLAPVGDPDALGAALADLLADTARRRAWGEAARRSVVDDFSLNQMIQGYESIYNTLIPQH